MSDVKETGLRGAIIDLEDFIDQPPSYESEKLVRDYRHELYPRWGKVRDLALAMLSAAPSPAEALPSQTSGAEAGGVSVGVKAELLAEHTGCGHGVQVDMLTVRLLPGDTVLMVRGPLGRATLPVSGRVIDLASVISNVEDAR